MVAKFFRYDSASKDFKAVTTTELGGVVDGVFLRPDLKKSMDPPPAATVLTSSWGAWIVTPAVVDSNTCS